MREAVGLCEVRPIPVWNPDQLSALMGNCSSWTASLERVARGWVQTPSCAARAPQNSCSQLPRSTLTSPMILDMSFPSLCLSFLVYKRGVLVVPN